MSLRIDTSDLISGALVIGDVGLGVLGSDIPVDAPLYNDSIDPDKEYRYVPQSIPAGLSIFFYEDSTFTAPPPDEDGTYTILADVYEDGATYGTSELELTWGTGTDTALTPGVGTLSIAGHAPTVARTAHQAVAPGVGSLSIAGHAPTVAQTLAGEVRPGAGVLSITGHAPTISQPHSVAPGVGSLSITGYAPTVTQASVLDVVPGTGVLALSGHAPTIAQTAGVYVAPQPGVITITGFAPTVAQTGRQVLSAPPTGRRNSTTSRPSRLSTTSRPRNLSTRTR